MSERTVPPAAALDEQIAKIEWFHRIALARGVVTPGFDDSPRRLRTLDLPDRMDGLTVLDVGSWDGFFAFEAERRGARRVLATDSFIWQGRGAWGSKQGFELARRMIGSRVEDMDIDVLDLSPARVGVFDVVFFLGVLYHMRHPLLALERIASVTSSRLILETHVEFSGLRPRLTLYPGAELDNDPTNWCGPNCAAVTSMLRDVGFARVERVWPGALFYGPVGAAVRLTRGLARTLVRRRAWWPSLVQGRAVFHAWK